MPLFRSAVLAVAVSPLVITPLLAQPAPRARGFVNFNIAIEEGPQQVSLSVPSVVYGQPGVITVNDSITGMTMLDMSGGVRGARFLFGGGYSRSSIVDTHEFTASTTPAPGSTFTRTLNYITPGLTHTERTIYVFAGMIKQVTNRFDAVIAGGPAFFALTQEIPDELIQTPDVFGRFVSMDTRSVDESTVGFHGALDLNYLFHPRIGLGVLFRYTWGSVDLPDSTDSMTLGGVQIGAGARVRF